MQFTWIGWAGLSPDAPQVFTNSGVLVTNVFEVGYYGIRLQVNDSISTGYPYYFLLEVTTAGQEINSILASLQEVTLPAQHKRILTNILSKAAIKFDQGHTAQGCADLRVFKNLLRVFKLNPLALDFYSNKTQFIIDAFKQPPR
jgi:hypothetical protein